MSNRPTRATIDGCVYLDLQNLARRSGRNTDELLRLYALECLLARLALSSHASKLVLKGGVLLAAYGTRRATRDIDLLAQQMTNDLSTVVELVRDAASFTVDDGVRFKAADAEARPIRDGDAYQGVRVELQGELATARVDLHVDINVGDPVWPMPQLTTLPGLLGRDVTLLGYPLAMIYAEKILTALDRGSPTLGGETSQISTFYPAATSRTARNYADQLNVWPLFAASLSVRSGKLCGAGATWRNVIGVYGVASRRSSEMFPRPSPK
jgi:hypothetical protein